MKKLLIYILPLLFAGGACKEKSEGKNGIVFSNALQYNNYILDRQTAVKVLMNKLLQEKDTSLERAEQTLQSAVAFTDKSIIEISGMPDWKGNNTFRDSTVMLFQFYKKTLAEDFKRLMAAQEDEKITPVEAAEYSQISDRIRRQQYVLDSGLQATQQRFAIENGFEKETSPAK